MNFQQRDLTGSLFRNERKKNADRIRNRQRQSNRTVAGIRYQSPHFGIAKSRMAQVCHTLCRQRHAQAWNTLPNYLRPTISWPEIWITLPFGQTC
jgi:hypothetical protein